ncbi:zinc finger protein 316-like [Amphibalanus amphitrite]|uniref:zinc finger protein 316-like n=1 Tax=Amphibalanus amphitrite TaxID=1232801 RepID=UPI001C922090|nr:zinc finger protein 316-like [Amphibalanus amphitrite]
MATLDATASSPSATNGDPAVRVEPMAVVEVQSEESPAEAECVGLGTLEAENTVVVELIKPDPDTVEVSECDGVTTVAHCDQVMTDRKSAEMTSAGLEGGDLPSASPSPPVASPLTPPPPPPEEEDVKQEQQELLSEQESKTSQQQLLEHEQTEAAPQPMDTTEASDGAPPAPDAAAAGRTVHVLVSDSVAWMRPAGESAASESPAVCDVTAVVTPTGSARRKASGVAPRRVPQEVQPVQRLVTEKWPRRGRGGGVSRASRVSVISSLPAAGAEAAGRRSAPPAAAAAAPPPLPFDCDACRTRFSDRISLAVHCREHGGAPAEPCSRCGRLLAAPLDRARHERRHRAARQDGAPATRRRAAQTAASPATPTRLLPQRRGREPTRCGSCGERFRARELREHFAPHPRTGFYRCTGCYDAFAQQCQLERHICTGEAQRRPPEATPPAARTRNAGLRRGREPSEEPEEEEVVFVEEESGDVSAPPPAVAVQKTADREGRLAAEKPSNATNGEKVTVETEAEAVEEGDDHADEEEAYEDGAEDGTEEDDPSDGGGSGGDGDSHECSECGQRFASARNLSRHARTHSNRPQLSCEVCERAYSRLDALVRHSVDAHEQARQFPCPRCRWKFPQRRILEYHLKAHDREGRPAGRGPGRRPRPFRCKACKRSFMEASQLEEHECRADRSGEPGYICDICGKTIKTKMWLSRHRLLHGDQRPAKCETCGQGFIDDKALAKHVKTHTDGRRFLCDTCGKGFALKVTLQIHSRTHTGERPFACETCGKRFSTRTQLFHHSKIHSGEKPYVCTVCQRGFRQSHHLKTHMKIHADRPERHIREARNARAMGVAVSEEPVLEGPPGTTVLAQLTEEGRPLPETLCDSEG